MSVRNLEYLLRPTSVAVIGASDRPNSVGSVVMRNLLRAGFGGPIMPVNPKHRSVAGVLCHRDIASLPLDPDLAVICTPPPTVPGIIEEIGRRNGRAAVVLTAGLGRKRTSDGRTVQQAMLDAARPHLLRVLGPNCIGVLVPGLGLDASFAHRSATPGSIAFVSQSGALCTAVLDWAGSSGIGFSHFISIGDSADVDFGDILDYLASDPSTRSILLYVEAVKHARKFMSAARAAARNKPVVAVKAGRVAEAEKAAASHTGALAGGDDAYSAAFRRAGILRVDGIDDLFAAVETLARARGVRGDRLSVLTNGGGPGVMAVDDLIVGGGRLADLSAETVGTLDRLLPGTWSRSNPVDIIGDADADRYAKALSALLGDPGVDTLLVMHAPTAVVSSLDAAKSVVQAAKGVPKSVLTCWLGRDTAEPPRRLFGEAGLPTYETPEEAVRAFLHMVEYRRAQDALLETPRSAPIEFTPDTEQAQAVIRRALQKGRTLLSEPEAKAVLSAYGVPVVETVIATSVEDAARQADDLGYPVALKILSPAISHKSDVGGVALDLETRSGVIQAAETMLARVRRLRPDAPIEGFTVQKMARRPRAHELIVGAATDPIFGPVILFGQGGTAVEIIRDRAVALPPLTMGLALELISRTRVARLLAGYRDRPKADLDALALALVQVSQLIADIPEVTEFDINPLFADETGVLALDARIALGQATVRGRDRLAIPPYPQELEETIELPSGLKLLLRPIRPEDASMHAAFFARLDPEDVRFRFFGPRRTIPPSEMARLTQIDYDREMALIALDLSAGQEHAILGVARTVTDPDNDEAEVAVIVRSDVKRRGIGRALLQKMIRYCTDRGTRILTAHIMRENTAMLRLAEGAGFQAKATEDKEVVDASLALNRG